MVALSGAGVLVPESTWRERAMAIGCAVVLTAVMTYPMVTQFGSAGRLDTNDGKFSIWNVAWVAHALVTDPRHLFDANIFWPHRATLTYSELNLVAGVLATPVYAISRNPLAAHNSAVFLGLAFAFLATWALVRRLTGSSASGLIAATGYAFSAYTSSHTAEIQLLMIFGFPLVMSGVHHLHGRPDVRSGLRLGAALAATALACGYYGVFAGGLTGLSALWWARRDRVYWVAIAIAAAAAVAFVAPVVIPYLLDRAAEGVVTNRTMEEVQIYSADWRAYLRSSSDLGVTWLPWVGVHGEVLFPGIVLSLGAVAGLFSMRGAAASRRRTILGYAVIACLAAWASLGPSFGLYRLLAHLLPGISFLRAPARLAPVVILAFAVLAGFGFAALIDRVQRRWARAVAIPLTTLVLLLTCGELWVRWPLQPMPPVPHAYRQLATLPRGAVVDFPFPYTNANFHNHAWSMVMSTYHWQPLVNGYSDFIPPDFHQLAIPINGFPNAESFAILRAHDVRYVIIRAYEYGPKLATLRARFPAYAANLHRLNDDEDVWLFQIVSYPESAPGQ